MIRIIADSTSNLPQSMLEQHRILSIPLFIQFGQQTFREGIDIDTTTFFHMIDEEGKLPTTSQPPPAAFAKAYKKVHEAGDSAIVITVTSKHSGTYQSALLAKSLVPEADIAVFDSRSISLGTGWIVLEAARAAEQGLAKEAILKRIEAIRDTTTLFLAPGTVKYFLMSGRVSTLQGALASVLKIKPIITVNEGLLDVKTKVRTMGKAVDRMLDMMHEQFNEAPLNLAVVHVQCMDEGKRFLERASTRLNIKETLFANLTPSLAAHGGPGGLGILAFPAEQ